MSPGSSSTLVALGALGTGAGSALISSTPGVGTAVGLLSMLMVMVGMFRMEARLAALEKQTGTARRS